MHLQYKITLGLIALIAASPVLGEVSRNWPQVIRGSNAGINVAEEFALVKNWNFNVIRFWIHCDSEYADVTTPPEGDPLDAYRERIAALDDGIVWAKRHGLKLILVLGTCVGRDSGYFWENSDTSYALWEHAGQLWAAVAEKYQDEDTILGYDLLNEPQFSNPAAIAQWSYIAPGIRKGGVVSLDAKSGRRSLMFEQDTANWYVAARQVVENCEPDTTYTLSGHIKPSANCSDGESSNYGIQWRTYCLDVDGTVCGDGPHNTPFVDCRSETWQKVSATFVSASDCAQISVEARFTNASGRAYFDDVILHKGDSINANLLSAPGFEDHTGWWIGGGDSVRTDVTSYEGDYCAKLDQPSGFAVASQTNISLTPGKQ